MGTIRSIAADVQPPYLPQLSRGTPHLTSTATAFLQVYLDVALNLAAYIFQVLADEHSLENRSWDCPSSE